MDAQRFFPVSYDMRNNPKLVELGIRQGGKMAAIGRWVALLSVLYDCGGVVDLGKDFTDGGEMTPRAEMLRMELDFASCFDLMGFLRDALAVGLLDLEAWAAMGHVVSGGVADQIAYRKKKSDAGRMGGRPKKKAGALSTT